MTDTMTITSTPDTALNDVRTEKACDLTFALCLG